MQLELDEQEAGILRELLKEMRMLLEADIPREDDVLRRLFPPAHTDEGEQRAYEELVGNTLLESKREALQRVEGDLGSSGQVQAELDAEALDTWLRVLNDLRLAIGTRLDVDERKMEKPYDPNDPEAPALAVLHWLAWLQDTMLEETITKQREEPDA
jgi:hypothetical protein